MKILVIGSLMLTLGSCGQDGRYYNFNRGEPMSAELCAFAAEKFNEAAKAKDSPDFAYCEDAK